MTIDDLTDEAVEKYFRLISTGLQYNQPVEIKRIFLEMFIMTLDDLDDDDTFGTEGWRKAFGLGDKWQLQKVI